MLNLAVDDGILETALKIKLDSEKKFARRRVVLDEEFEALLEQSPRYLQRLVIGLYETAMRRDQLLKLTWDKVDERAGVIRLMPNLAHRVFTRDGSRFQHSDRLLSWRRKGRRSMTW